jgi:hypothetical protein
MLPSATITASLGQFLQTSFFPEQAPTNQQQMQQVGKPNAPAVTCSLCGKLVKLSAIESGTHADECSAAITLIFQHAQTHSGNKDQPHFSQATFEEEEEMEERWTRQLAVQVISVAL